MMNGKDLEMARDVLVVILLTLLMFTVGDMRKRLDKLEQKQQQPEVTK